MTNSDPMLLAIFDHDGVLVDSLSMHQHAWLELGRREGLPITLEFVHETFGMTNPMIFDRLLQGEVSPQDAQRFGDLKEECYRDLATGKVELMEGVRELLDDLAESGFKLAIGSSAPGPNVALTVRECGLTERITAVAALEDVRRGKPDPEVFLLAAARAGVPPGRAVVFEDAPIGIQAAKSAGMRAVGVTTTHPPASLWNAGADEVVANLKGYDVAGLASRLGRIKG